MDLERLVTIHLRRSDWAVDLPKEQVGEILSRHGVDPWYSYALTERWRRWHVWKPSAWLVKTFGAPVRVFETGCGCGYNLFWFGRAGSRELYGSDRDEQVIAVGREMAALANVPCKLWVDDALQPESVVEKNDAVLALNWTYHAPGFDLDSFLATYRRMLNRGGWLLIDLIDRSFDRIPNNQFLTSDWQRPVDERRPSEYLHRYEKDEAQAAFRAGGFRVLKVFTRHETVPRNAYVLIREDY